MQLLNVKTSVPITLLRNELLTAVSEHYDAGENDKAERKSDKLP